MNGTGPLRIRIFAQLAFVLAAGSPLSVEAASQTSANDPIRHERETIEVSNGRGFVGQGSDVLGRGPHRMRTTNWVDLKFRPVPNYGWQAIGIQVGAHQSDDLTKNFLCKKAASVAGRVYCSTAESEYHAGPHFLALYGGINAEIIELAVGEPRPFRLHMGTGATRVQSITFKSSVLPYSSLEVSYRLKKQLQAKAGVFVGLIKDTDELGVAAPAVSVEYRF
ncbi:MAG TPA: hypothetical protein VJB59_12700 [Bdellovibrionota bacterium]|nr:hypothetical protein [Bdellovibrionota bacterium]